MYFLLITLFVVCVISHNKDQLAHSVGPCCSYMQFAGVCLTVGLPAICRLSESIIA